MAAAAMSDDAMGKALWDAAEAGNTGEVTRLLKAGAPVNWSNVYRQTPLMRAATFGHVESIQVLLDRGADLEAKDKAGKSAIDLSKAEHFKALVPQILGTMRRDPPCYPALACKLLTANPTLQRALSACPGGR
ncbi:hypothetical protein FNF29_03366 [Cafeteria roenbergensis]|uniref:Uncharacterized protein n=1 Tax=Cafeteria roenbergensis TaxID=33653 RepID=A0A5A8CKZ0_CAFRO|nr:hypothetical protein FNF29_03366 [Cafeteria roenbergensis]|eukprot:KAA0153177.1 hypothetical protein FNF29_03366 [Cafeteria roenbergensis]